MLKQKDEMRNKISPVISQSLGSLVTAFGLVAALAWNEAVKSLIENFFPKGQSTLSLFIYAFLVTALAVILGSRLIKLKQRLEEKASEPEQQ